MPVKGSKWTQEQREKIMAFVKTRNYNGQKNPKWRGGKVIRSDGRVFIYMPNHPNVSYCGTHVLEYRLLAEKKIGRYLRKDEVVHHVDGNILNNAPENLEVMTQSEHAKFENTRRDKITGRFARRWVYDNLRY